MLVNTKKFFRKVEKIDQARHEPIPALFLKTLCAVRRNEVWYCWGMPLVPATILNRTKSRGAINKELASAVIVDDMRILTN
mgnify:CR=1 FL=1